MKKKFIAGVVVFVAGFIAAFALMAYYNAWMEKRALPDEVPVSDIRPTAAVPEGGPVPSVSIEAFVDDSEGYNLRLVTENFTFSPGLLGEVDSPNTGYATLYINERKHARIYGEWYHIGYNDLANGQNTVEIILTTNNHALWTAQDVEIADTVILEKIQ